MEYPHGHHNHHNNHHNHRRDDENPNDYPPPPPPTYGGGYPNSPPRNYPPPPPSYGGGSYSPPSYGGAFSHAPPQNDYAPPSYGGSFSHAPPQNDYAPPSYGGSFSHRPQEDYPPPAQVTGAYHTSHNTHMESPNYPSQQHSSSFGDNHEFEKKNEESDGGSHHFRPHIPGFIQQHFHHSPSNVSDEYNSSEGGGSNLGSYFANKSTYKIYCKAGGTTYSVAIRDGKVVLTLADHNDPTQHWYKDEKFSTKVKDEDGYPSFALVNKSTGQAVKHSVSGHPVQLIPYKPDDLDSAILWTESKDLGSGFRTIRNVNNVKLVMDAFNGDKDHGGVHDGTVVAVYKCWKGDNQNQQWKIYPYCKSLNLSFI